MRARRITEPGSRFRDLKYRLLGINAPEKLGLGVETRPEWTEQDTINYLRQTRTLAQAIIAELSRMTDLSLKPANIPPMFTKMSRLDTGLLQYTESGSPAVPPPYTAESLISELVPVKYGPQDLQLLSKWVYSWLNPQNLRPEMSTSAYNWLIGFALHNNDVGLALHAVDIMRTHRCVPNRLTLHLFLNYNAHQIDANPYPRLNLGHPLVNTHLCLKKMRAADVRADSLTWNLVMQCMPFGFGKSFVLEEMDRRNIALENGAKQSLLRTIIDDRNQPGKLSTDISRHIDALDAADPVVLRSVADHLLVQKSPKNVNVVSAWHLLTKSPRRDSSLAMLHVFMARFAYRKHLDWQFGVLGAFGSTEWDSNTWEYLLEAASFMRNNDTKPVVLGTLLQQAERENVVLTARSRYLARRATRCFSLRDMGPANWQTIRQGLEWTDALCPRRPELLRAIGFSDEGIALESEPAQLDTSRFLPMPRTDSWERRSELARELK